MLPEEYNLRDRDLSEPDGGGCPDGQLKTSRTVAVFWPLGPPGQGIIGIDVLLTMKRGQCGTTSGTNGEVGTGHPALRSHVLGHVPAGGRLSGFHRDPCLRRRQSHIPRRRRDPAAGGPVLLLG